MNILLVNGSPHKGNTWKLAELAKAQITKSAPDTAFRELHLHTAKLPLCLGCSNCFRKGGDYCPHRAVMDAVLGDFEWADGVIVSSSTFNMAPAATLINLLDHMCYMLHRPRFFTKKGLVIATTGGIGAGKASQYVAGALSGIGFNRVYRLPVVASSWNSYEPANKDKRKAEKAVAKFFADVQSRVIHKPHTVDLIAYNLFRGMCRYHVEGSAYPTADGPFWTDPVRAKRCYDAAVPVGLWNRIAGGLFCLTGKISGKRTVITYRKQESA